MKVHPIAVKLFPAQYKNSLNSDGSLNEKEFESEVVGTAIGSGLLGLLTSIITTAVFLKDPSLENVLLFFVQLAVFSVLFFVSIGSILDAFNEMASFLKNSIFIKEEQEKPVEVKAVKKLSLGGLLKKTFAWQAHIAETSNKDKESRSLVFILLVLFYLGSSLFISMLLMKGVFGLEKGYDYPVLAIMFVNSLLNNTYAKVLSVTFGSIFSLFEDGKD